MNRLYYFAPKQVNSELRNTCIISMTCFCSCWTGCFGVTQKRLLKDQVGRVKWWPWCGAGHQEQPGTDLAQANPKPQAGWQWHAAKKQMQIERPEFPHGPSKHCWASVTPGERVVARHRFSSTRYSYRNCKIKKKVRLISVQLVCCLESPVCKTSCNHKANKNISLWVDAWSHRVRLKGNAWVSCISQGWGDGSLFLILAVPREVWLQRWTSETQTRIGNSNKCLMIAKWLLSTTTELIVFLPVFLLELLRNPCYSMACSHF